MAQIYVLDKHTAELIAAGEVVERPSSVVKELCENSIDAGSKNIVVSIERGGVKLIQIQDDGTGIEAEFVATAFLRHATSKVRTQDDLEAIHTLGFRGEALASIASVAKVELLTKTKDDEFASIYRVDAGQEVSFEAAARPIGTTITVKDLFYNTPARMKFLKKDTSEANYVSEVVSQLALSHPEVSFKLIRDNKISFQTPGDGNVQSAAYEVLGRDFAKDLVNVSYNEGNYTVKGYVTPPRLCRQSRSMQYFIVNGRFVKNRTMMAALENAYRSFLMQGKFPGCVLELKMPAELVDVNVHPAKIEVRFARDSDIFDAIYCAVKQSIIVPSTQNTASQNSFIANNEAPVKQTNFTETGLNNNEQLNSQTQKAVEVYLNNLASISSTPENTLKSDISVNYSTTGTENLISLPIINSQTVKNEQPNIIIDNFIPEQEAVKQTYLYETAPEKELKYIGEVFKTYIICEFENKICYIDKHAAHERILYEKLVKSYGAPDNQLLLEPVAVTLGAAEKSALVENLEIIEQAGVEIEDFGGTSVLVRSVPSDVETTCVEDLVVELAHRMSLNKRDNQSAKTQWVLHSISCRAAIKAGDKTNKGELLQLATDILNNTVPPFCPHGRPIIVEFSKKELEKQFGR